MRYVWITFIGLAALMLSLLVWQRQPSKAPAEAASVGAPNTPLTQARARAAVWVSNKPVPRADSVVRFAMEQLGTPYVYAGATPTAGFDCSGFVMYVYGRFGIDVPHSTAMLINTGRPIPRSQARPGDLVIFTGTASDATEPGHAGIIISKPGEPIRFIHSSSARRQSGVKISAVDETGYARRFMGVRRVLDAE
ncbi:C40 family peptidase [Hymenobacter radiodurans]|uniref:C40 family peptidase n=1 Tax=Hymenobacter radiodurans TaxID=2496028 RepID=UPI001058DDBF|nr:C40 family peptidase [Hymenobacter radiodurans]